MCVTILFFSSRPYMKTNSPRIKQKIAVDIMYLYMHNTKSNTDIEDIINAD